jgi:hypothetical protein
MWSGTAASWQNLHNEKFEGTQAYGIGGGQQVGAGIVPPGFSHAVMWNGTPESAVDLHPKGDFDLSQANDTDGLQQVGFAREPSKLNPHAALWTGSAASFVDLHPSGYLFSELNSVDNGQQVGKAIAPIGVAHAGLWHGTANTFVDLNPATDWGSVAEGTNGTAQVGWAASFTGPAHAVRWFGSAASMLDIHGFLPASYHGTGEQSRAMGIDEFGNIVGWALDLDDGGRAKAVLWRPIPEPSGVVALGLFVAIFALRRRRI